MFCWRCSFLFMLLNLYDFLQLISKAITAAESPFVFSLALFLSFNAFVSVILRLSFVQRSLYCVEPIRTVSSCSLNFSQFEYHFATYLLNLFGTHLLFLFLTCRWCSFSSFLLRCTLCTLNLETVAHRKIANKFPYFNCECV